MVLKLYGYPTSTCTLRVAVVLKEKNVPFEFISVDLAKGEHKAAGFVAHQPFGQVPYIDDDGFVLFESRAIARYIATKFASQGNALIPTDAKKNALYSQDERRSNGPTETLVQHVKMGGTEVGHIERPKRVQT